MSASLTAQARAAEWYADRMGWAVFPLHSIGPEGCSCPKGWNCESAGKHPRTLNGLNDASTVLGTVARWWRTWPDANVGTVTGIVSGFVVLDVDLKDGRDGQLALELLEKEHGQLPETVESVTGSGGRHLFFQHPATTEIKNRTAIRPGLDVRGDGGYVVVPPSVHASGRTYQYEASSGPRDVEIAEPPKWLLELIQTPHGDGAKRAEPVGDTILVGARNASLTSLAGTMRRRGLAAEEMLPTLQAVNERRCAPPLPPASLERICRSVERYVPAAPIGGGLR